MTAVVQRSFSSGEIAPPLYGRVDQAKYATALRTCRNMPVMRHGGVVSRPGSQFIAEVKDSTHTVRLIPFIFNNQQTYVLEFSHLAVRVFQNGGLVITGGGDNSFASPYAAADIAGLKYAQTGDVLTLVHPNYAPREFQRLSANSFQFVQIVFGSTLISPGSITVTGTAHSGSTPTYLVSTVDAAGNETDSAALTLLSIATGLDVAAASPTTPITISWDAVVGAVSYRVYLTPSTGGSNFSFIGETSQLQFVDTGIIPDFAVSYPFNPALFQSANNYPSAVGFAQQRRVFAAPNNNPTTVYMTRSGSYSNLDYHQNNLQDDDAITFDPASEKVNLIEHIVELRAMLLFTSGAEIQVQGDASGIVRPTAINPQAQSYFGSGALKPIVFGDVCIFQQAQGWFVRDFGFDFSIDGYRGNDLTIFSPHLFEGFQLVDWGFQQIPHSIIWAVRSDGTLLGLTYIREQQILAWHRHDFSGGVVENVCVIPESPEDGVYLCIRRTILGVTKRYIERLSNFYWADVLNAPFLDSWLKYDGTNLTGTTMVLDGGSGAGVTVTTHGITNITNEDPGFITQPNHGFHDHDTITFGPDEIQGMTELNGHTYGIFFQTVNTYILYDINTVELVDTTNFGVFISDTGGSGGGGSTSGNWGYTDELHLTASNNFFTPQMVNDQIFLNDSQGNQIRCTIILYNNAQVVTILPNKTVPLNFRSVPFLTWTHAVATVTGLDHLNGQRVSVFADRFVVASVNNGAYPSYTVNNGQITLEKPYGVIYVGLPMTQDLETLDMDAAFGETMMDKKKIISRVNLYVNNTRGVFAGNKNPDTDPLNEGSDPLFGMMEYKGQGDRQQYDPPPSLKTEPILIAIPSEYNYNGRVFVRQVDPLPMQILSVAPTGMETGESANYLRA